jgi:ABC-2 type transport system permease protein
MALFFREWKEVLRVPAYALNGLVGIVLLPVMMVAFSLGSGSNGELSELLGQVLRQARGDLVMLVIAAAMAFVSTVNMAGATAVSREGKRFPFTRMIPVPYRTQLMAKQLFGFSINFLTCLTTLITMLILLPGQAFYMIAAFAMGLLFGFFANALSLILDVKHPRFDWRNETEAIKQNPMAILFMFLTWVVAFALGFGVWGLYSLGVSLSLVSWLLALVLALLALGSYYMLLREADNSYAKLEM